MESPRYESNPRNSDSDCNPDKTSLELDQSETVEKPFIVISHSITDDPNNYEANPNNKNCATKSFEITEDNINILKKDLTNSDLDKKILILKNLRWVRIHDFEVIFSSFTMVLEISDDCSKLNWSYLNNKVGNP